MNQNNVLTLKNLRSLSLNGKCLCADPSKAFCPRCEATKALEQRRLERLWHRKATHARAVAFNLSAEGQQAQARRAALEG